jgi:hypothetical protein
VTWTDSEGVQHEGVFIPRRDTGSILNHFAGGRIFPGEHHLADFDVEDDGVQIAFSMKSRDGAVSVRLQATESDSLPAASRFTSVLESSKFFEGGSLGYSVTRDSSRLDGLRLVTSQWHVRPLNVEKVYSSIFSNPDIFPPGSVEFDHALIMRNIPHEWHQADELRVQTRTACVSMAA